MNPKSELTEKYAGLYRDNIDRILPLSSPYMNSFRKEAFEKFMELGVPTKKNETYKYTNLGLFFDHDYRSYFLPSVDDFVKAEEFRCDVADLDTHGIVLVNGFYPTVNGKLRELPGGIIVGSLNEAALRYPELVEKHYARYAASDNDGLVHLNTALASDGVFVYVPPGSTLSKPVQVVNLVQSDGDTFTQHRNLLIIEKGARFSIIICDHTLSPHKFLTNAVTEVYVGDGAVFDIVRVQNEHNAACKMTHTFIHQERNSVASSNNMTLHGGLIRNSTYHQLTGEGAESHSFGLYLADKWQHVDNFVNVEHLAPNCHSNQLFKGVLDDMSTGTFNGRILVRPDAQKTLA
ncbi:MAG: SufD family Fe-S cluster assembly protein, partial [Bacteroidales bacterium]|nr:SufD family Fe-S cluster assembly protein [Bacteroidales bacterium]